jgi:hypothetical protein
MRCRGWLKTFLVVVAVLAVGGLAVPVGAQVTPPDTSVCDGVDECTVPKSLCSAAGFKITLTSFQEANTANSGVASYTYQICSPAAGSCSNDATKSCLDNSQCETNRCQNGGPNKGTCSQDDTTQCSVDSDCNVGVTCSRECPTDKFNGLSHFDVIFPALGGSCLGETTKVTGTCSNGNFVLGDGSCFDGGTSDTFVAKCDNTSLAAGQCLTMTINIPGELNKPGLGAAVVVDKEATTCTANCLAGPSCETCGGENGGGECLTRTIGFWGTHPWITNDYAPVMVCAKSLVCDGLSDGKSNPSCEFGHCNDIMEGLGSIGSESPKNSAYIAMVKQLTAAKLNLNATAALAAGATCADFRYNEKSIQTWITDCEALCGASDATISGSGCTEALNAFNNSQDTGFDVTPSPFDRPPVDDLGNISGADSSGFTGAQSNNKGQQKLVIGKNLTGTGAQCAAP